MLPLQRLQRQHAKAVHRCSVAHVCGQRQWRRGWWCGVLARQRHSSLRLLLLLQHQHQQLVIEEAGVLM